MAWMVQADGNVAAAERALLDTLAGSRSVAERALRAVQGVSLDVLIPEVERYADRFFIAMRARTCALADGRLDPGEIQAFHDLVAAFQLLPQDVAKITEVAAAAARGEDSPPDDRVRALFAASSFVTSLDPEAPPC